MDVSRAPVDVEVSIVSLRGGPQLKRCVATLQRACAGLTWRLTLVDNSPNGLDHTSCFRGLPDSVVLRSEGRRGFGANQNLALARVVHERRARYVLVLNDDAELGDLAVTTLVRYADQRPRAGAISPVIRDLQGSLEPSIVAWPRLSSLALSCALPSRPRRKTATEGWLNGACMLVRTAALAQVGLFDPRYFLYYEETDLCRRMARAGWQLEQCAGAVVVHHRRQSTMLAGSALEIDEQILRSGYLYFRKHHGRLAARSFNGLVRCGLLARTAKAAVEDAAGRGAGGVSSTGRLWALTRFRPSRPTRFEIEAQANVQQSLTRLRTACRTGR